MFARTRRVGYRDMCDIDRDLCDIDRDMCDIDRDMRDIFYLRDGVKILLNTYFCAMTRRVT